MSGPKISYYGLNTEQKQLLNTQWQCYRDTLTGFTYIDKLADVMVGRYHELAAMQLKLKHMAEVDAFYIETACMVDELVADLHATCADFKASTKNHALPIVQRSRLDEITTSAYKKTRIRALALKDKAMTFSDQINATIAASQDAITRYEAKLYGDLLQELEPIAKSDTKPTVDYRALDLNKMQISETTTAEKTAADIKKLKAILDDKLAAYAQNVPLAQLKAQIEGARLKLESINGMVFLKNFYTITIKPLLTESENVLVRNAILTTEYRELYSRYLILCQERAVTPQLMSATTHNLQELRNLITAMETTILQDMEQAHICNSIDMVMSAMGYRFLGRRKVSKKNGRCFKHELYSFKEGTAVDITYADDGQITMELGGLDYSDRVPDTAETEKLCREMEYFCREFDTIEARLAEQGVVVNNRVEVLDTPPEYAAIINFSEYEPAPNQKIVVFSAQAP